MNLFQTEFNELNLIKNLFSKQLNSEISNLVLIQESQEYHACSFDLNQKKIIYRFAKITPTKVGQFVTIWKRNSAGITEPFAMDEEFDFFIISCASDEKMGFFIFSKEILAQQNIISTQKKVGKRGTRVYPIWDKTDNKQAIKTQKWQLNYFFEVKNGVLVNFDELTKIINN